MTRKLTDAEKAARVAEHAKKVQAAAAARAASKAAAARLGPLTEAQLKERIAKILGGKPEQAKQAADRIVRAFMKEVRTKGWAAASRGEAAKRLQAVLAKVTAGTKQMAGGAMPSTPKIPLRGEKATQVVDQLRSFIDRRAASWKGGPKPLDAGVAKGVKGGLDLLKKQVTAGATKVGPRAGLGEAIAGKLPGWMKSPVAKYAGGAAAFYLIQNLLSEHLIQKPLRKEQQASAVRTQIDQLLSTMRGQAADVETQIEAPKLAASEAARAQAMFGVSSVEKI